jgi:hypothetical protein
MPDGNKMQGYTVCCSSGYGSSRWHSYQGPPNKEFDTTWKTDEEANARARYLFYWKNCYGISAEELDADDCQESEKHGLKEFRSRLRTVKFGPSG